MTIHPPNQDEFAGFMQAYQDMVFSTVVRMTGNVSQAEDLAQEVFLRAYENFDLLRHSAGAGGWLKTVARNITINYLTRHRKRWRLFSELRPVTDVDDDTTDFDVAVAETAFEQLEASQRHALIEAALRELPEQQRLALVLYHFEELSYEQIAATLRVSLAKVKIDIHRARMAMARALTRVGIVGTSEHP